MLDDKRHHVVIASFHGVGTALRLLVQSTSYRWFVYLQCDQKCTMTPSIEECKRRESCHLSYLPNIGRESRVYLHHILMMYDRLPPLLYFLQENEINKLRLGSAPAADRNVWYPGPRRHPCSGGSACGGSYCWKQGSLGSVTNRIMQVAFNRSCRNESFACGLRACFAVRRRGILQHPISTYIALARIAENKSRTLIAHGCSTTGFSRFVVGSDRCSKLDFAL